MPVQPYIHHKNKQSYNPINHKYKSNILISIEYTPTLNTTNIQPHQTELQPNPMSWTNFILFVRKENICKPKTITCINNLYLNKNHFSTKSFIMSHHHYHLVHPCNNIYIYIVFSSLCF